MYFKKENKNKNKNKRRRRRRRRNISSTIHIFLLSIWTFLLSNRILLGRRNM